MLRFIPISINLFSEWTAKMTDPFVKTRFGKLFLALVLIGPVTFLPTLYQAWTAPDIDALRTSTWPLLIIVNISAFIGVAHEGDWRLRLTMLAWVIFMIIISLAVVGR